MQEKIAAARQTGNGIDHAQDAALIRCAETWEMTRRDVVIANDRIARENALAAHHIAKNRLSHAISAKFPTLLKKMGCS